MDISYHCGGSQTTCRNGISVSYGFSNNLMVLQIDAVYADGDFLGDNPNDDPEESNSVWVSSNRCTLIYVDDGDD